MNDLSSEKLRELARRIREQLPPGVFFSLVVWPPGDPSDCAYFSNAHKAEAILALTTLTRHVKRERPDDTVAG